MKKLISFTLLLFFAVAQFASAQKTLAATDQEQQKKPMSYTEVIQVPGASKDLLYERAMKTLPKMYKEFEKKITENDKQNGKILVVTKTRTELKDPKSGEMRPDIYINYKFSLNFKEGKYKYDFYDIHVDEGGFKTTIEKYLEPANRQPKDRKDEKLAYFDTEIKKLIETLKAGMKEDKVQVKEDW